MTAAEKVINLHVPQLYAIVRGKVGKKVEFGLTWGFTRLRGGFLLARLAQNKRELYDARFAVTAVEDHIALFGKAPRAYAYDRAGYSKENLEKLKALGVKDVGLAPRGRREWAVNERTKAELVKERALVEAGIGAVKSSRYNFHRPRARSTRMNGSLRSTWRVGFAVGLVGLGLGIALGAALFADDVGAMFTRSLGWAFLAAAVGGVAFLIALAIPGIGLVVGIGAARRKRRSAAPFLS